MKCIKNRVTEHRVMSLPVLNIVFILCHLFDGVIDPSNFVLAGIKCPVCSKFVLPDDVECHLVMCLTKPRISYNDDVLLEDKGECVICLEELATGDNIARLPCLCIYHKRCIDAWFEVNRSCPEHPLD
ncbi:conserved hypothetical protein [Ixodes scapularis]|uniref:E3 ubiquitin-protein ligase ZNRF1 n=1 Tax=Ixodes scapularis TaxID=6945 RepID=B7PES1_IXOSC|nr:conserved hypothetical protein [Ixodes scapularis]|eukprot:XP_002433693.1 conserved hypothetical protein [Ixodes scapularis]